MKCFSWPRYWLLPFHLLMAVSSLWVASGNPSRPGVTRANFEKIKLGMSEKEVNAILGVAEGGVLHDGGLRLMLFYHCSRKPPSPWGWEKIAVHADFYENRLTLVSLSVEKKTLAEWLRGWRAWAGL